jgi:ubiquinone/menaquinone biosynthesis C-methylase UbiE
MSTSPQAVEAAANPIPVWAMMTAYQQTNALVAAIEIDVFRAIGEGPGDVATLARKCNASERGVRILCDYLTIHGILEKRDEVYRHTPTSAAFLDPNSPMSVASAARFIANPEFIQAQLDLTRVVREGRTNMPGAGSVEPDNPIWVAFARDMAPVMAPAVGPMASAALDGRTGPLRVLDVATGHGLFGIGVLQQNPDARVVGLDWAAVLEVAYENADKARVRDRFEGLIGNAFEIAFPGPFDAVMLTNFLHHFDKPTNVSLLRKIYDSCNPGAVVATLEFVPNDDRVSPPGAATFSMMMLASTVAGDAYTFGELSDMYTEAGFTGMSAHPLQNSAETIVVGRKG